MRSFVAIDISDEATAALITLQRAQPFGRPVLPENMHLTLAFLDDQPEEALEAVHEELLALSGQPFSIMFSGIECFGQALAVRVVDCAALNALHRKVQSAARQAGIFLPRRRFRPHVTIARVKPWQCEVMQPALDPEATTAVPEMLVSGFSLFRSTLRPDGAQHDVLAQYTFDLTTR